MPFVVIASRSFDQFHFAIALAMQHFHFAFRVAEDKHFAITEFGFLHRLFQGQRLIRDGIRASDDMRLCEFDYRRKGMNGNGYELLMLAYG